MCRHFKLTAVGKCGKGVRGSMVNKRELTWVASKQQSFPGIQESQNFSIYLGLIVYSNGYHNMSVHQLQLISLPATSHRKGCYL